MAAAYAPVAQAIDWRFEPRIGATATFSDNVNQSATNAENGLSLSVTPGFSLSSHGSRRVQAVAQYSLSAVTRFGGNKGDDLYHNLSAIGKAELVEDFLFIDGSANISQQLISLLGPLADASVNDSNRATVGTYSISPYIVKRLGTFAVAQARYTASGAIFEDNAAADSSANTFTTSLSSGTRFNDLSWSVGYSILKASNRNASNAVYNEDVTLESAYAQAGYALSRKFRVFGTVGQDWNDYLSATKTSGSSYSVGFGWSPSRRTGIEASVGERYFGNTYSLAGHFLTRRSNWTVRYSEDVSDISQQFLERNNRLYFNCASFPGFRPAESLSQTPPSGCSAPMPLGFWSGLYRGMGVPDELLIQLGLPVAGTDGVFIVKNFTAGASWDLGRLGLSLSVYDTKRLDQFLADAQDHVRGAIGAASYRVSPLITAHTSLSFIRTSVDAALNNGFDREDDLVSLSLGIDRRFTKDLNGALTFRHTQRDSNDANADYDENSIMATANLRF